MIRIKSRFGNRVVFAVLSGASMVFLVTPVGAQVCAGQSLFNLVAVADGDHDMVVDEHDNCTAVPNPLQIDGDQDGYGNLCDADLNNDGGTGLDDVSEMLGLLNSSSPVGDLNGDGGVGMDDVVIVLGLMGTEPGPSSLICAGSVPCTSY